jgi:hypothetical protein
MGGTWWWCSGGTGKAEPAKLPGAGFSLTDLALMFLLWNEKEEEPDWDRVVREPVPISAENVRAALNDGLQAGVIQYVSQQTPGTVPDFLSKGSKPA